MSDPKNSPWSVVNKALRGRGRQHVYLQRPSFTERIGTCPPKHRGELEMSLRATLANNTDVRAWKGRRRPELALLPAGLLAQVEFGRVYPRRAYLRVFGDAIAKILLLGWPSSDRNRGNRTNRSCPDRRIVRPVMGFRLHFKTLTWDRPATGGLLTVYA